MQDPLNRERYHKRQWKRRKPFLPRWDSVPNLHLSPLNRALFTCEKCHCAHVPPLPICVWCHWTPPSAEERGKFEQLNGRRRRSTSPPGLSQPWPVIRGSAKRFQKQQDSHRVAVEASGISEFVSVSKDCIEVDRLQQSPVTVAIPQMRTNLQQSVASATLPIPLGSELTPRSIVHRQSLPGRLLRSTGKLRRARSTSCDNSTGFSVDRTGNITTAMLSITTKASRPLSRVVDLTYSAHSPTHELHFDTLTASTPGDNESKTLRHKRRASQLRLSRVLSVKVSSADDSASTEFSDKARPISPAPKSPISTSALSITSADSPSRRGTADDDDTKRSRASISSFIPITKFQSQSQSQPRSHNRTFSQPSDTMPSMHQPGRLGHPSRPYYSAIRSNMSSSPSPSSSPRAFSAMDDYRSMMTRTSGRPTSSVFGPINDEDEVEDSRASSPSAWSRFKTSSPPPTDAPAYLPSIFSPASASTSLAPPAFTNIPVFAAPSGSVSGETELHMALARRSIDSNQGTYDDGAYKFEFRDPTSRRYSASKAMSKLKKGLAFWKT